MRGADFESISAAPARGWRTFLGLWSSQSFSLFGTAMTAFALTIWLSQLVYPDPGQRRQLALALAVVGLSAGAPLLAAVPIAGTWADRHDRRSTMLVANLVCGAASIGLAWLIATGVREVAVMALPLALIAVATAFHEAALYASYGLLVPRAQLGRANGMMQLATSLATLLAPGAAAALISVPGLTRPGSAAAAAGDALRPLHDGVVLAVGLDGITFVSMALVLPLLTIPSPLRSDVDAGGRPLSAFWADTITGVRFIWRRRALLALLGVFMVSNLGAFSQVVLLPMIVRFNLAADSRAHGLTYQATLVMLTSLMSASRLAGGLVMSAWGGLRRAQVLGVLLPMIVQGLAQAAFGASVLVALSAVSTVVFSITNPIQQSHSQTVWQTATPPELQGRVFAVRRLMAQATAPAGIAFSGLVAGLVNPGYVMVAFGLASVAYCAVSIQRGWWRVEGRAGGNRRMSA
jgi:DHA3 family macrolide efflux protein-like MFS transporter